MSLELQVNEAMKEAMKAKQEGRLRGLRGIKSAILLAKTEKGATGELTEEKEIQLLQKMAKQRRESIEIFVTQNREDLALKEREEMEVIESFLPKQLSKEEIEVAVKQIIAEVGATSQKDMGKVMGVVSKTLAGKADGRLVSETVKSLLA